MTCNTSLGFDTLVTPLAPLAARALRIGARVFSVRMRDGGIEYIVAESSAEAVVPLPSCSSLPWLFNALGLGWAALSMQEEWRIATAACTMMGKALKAIRHVPLPLLYVLN